ILDDVAGRLRSRARAVLRDDVVRRGAGDDEGRAGLAVESVVVAEPLVRGRAGGGGGERQRLLGAGLILRAGAVGGAGDRRRGRHAVDLHDRGGRGGAAVVAVGDGDGVAAGRGGDVGRIRLTDDRAAVELPLVAARGFGGQRDAAAGA